MCGRCLFLHRLCCKTRKLQCQEFFAKTRSGRRSPIRIPSVAVPKSPVSLTREDQSPHVFTRKTRLQPAEFLITCAKRLLQHNPSNYGRIIASSEPTLWAIRRQTCSAAKSDLFDYLVSSGKLWSGPTRLCTYSLRRTKTTLIYRRTRILRAMQCFQGTKRSRPPFACRLSAGRMSGPSPRSRRSRRFQS